MLPYCSVAGLHLHASPLRHCTFGASLGMFLFMQYSSLAPLDYTAINQRSIIPAGTTRFEMTISIQNDDLNELSETFEVRLSLPDEPTVVITNTTIEIIDNDSE